MVKRHQSEHNTDYLKKMGRTCDSAPGAPPPRSNCAEPAGRTSARVSGRTFQTPPNLRSNRGRPDQAGSQRQQLIDSPRDHFAPAMSSTHTQGATAGQVRRSEQTGQYVLVVNPNSSALMTEGMRALAPHGAFVYYTAPGSVPESIDNEAHEHLSASECFSDLTSASGSDLIGGAIGVLVACFSNHPLAPMLQAQGHTALTILETAVLAALDRKAPFGVITTTPDLVHDIDVGVAAVLAKHQDATAPFLGTLPTGLRAIELKTLPRAEVQGRIKLVAHELLSRGARSLILGCSGTCCILCECTDLTRKRCANRHVGRRRGSASRRPGGWDRWCGCRRRGQGRNGASIATNDLTGAEALVAKVRSQPATTPKLVTRAAVRPQGHEALHERIRWTRGAEVNSSGELASCAREGGVGLAMTM